MSFSISSIKSHIVSFIQKEEHVIGGAVHQTIDKFVQHLEGKRYEESAIAYLEANGYVVAKVPASITTSATAALAATPTAGAGAGLAVGAEPKVEPAEAVPQPAA